MKTNIFFIVLFALGFASSEVQSQTTIYAKNSDISDNLDLRAVASIFGESANLQDFERRLNDPKYQISNLDLNEDNQVDYLRVIETVDNRTHVIIIQSVLDRDIYQDIATIDVERDQNNKVIVQVVGNTYLYGANYIYEPVYNVTPVIYASFWMTNYRPYYSSWNWNYYPSYYYAWSPYPVYRYRNNINVYINVSNHYNYVSTRRSSRAPVLYESRRSYGYETRRPNYSFAQRHSNMNNRYELEQKRSSNRATTGRVASANRNYAGNNSVNSNRNLAVNRTSTRENATTNKPVRVENRVKTQSRDYSATTRINSAATTGAPVVSKNNSVQNNNTARREALPKTESRGYDNGNSSRASSNSTISTARTSSAARVQAPKNYSENRASATNGATTSRFQSVQRTESPRISQGSGNNQAQRESSSNSRSSGRRN